MIKISKQSKHFMELTKINPIDFIEEHLDQFNGEYNVIRVMIHNGTAKILLYADKSFNQRENLIAEKTIMTDSKNGCCDYFLEQDGQDYKLVFVLEKTKEIKQRVLNKFN